MKKNSDQGAEEKLSADTHAEGKKTAGRSRKTRRWIIAAAAVVTAAAVCIPFVYNHLPSVEAKAEAVYDNGGRLSSPAEGKCGADFIRSYNTFGLDLLRRLDSNGETNAFLSPASIYLALGMTYGGAHGETANAFEKTLRFSDSNYDVFGKNCLGLQKMLSGDEFRLANAIWLSDSFRSKVSSGFLERDKTYFGASVGTLNFTDSSAPGVVNKWIKTNTNELIDPKIEKFDPLTVMFLANTIYFKDDWQSAFSPNATRDGTFRAPSGDKTVKFMNGKFDGYFEDSSVQGISLPYRDGKTSMLILLPKGGVDGLLKSLTPEQLTSYARENKNNRAILTLPRVDVKFDERLNDALKEMGLSAAYSKTADFSAMVNGDSQGEKPYLSDVRHMTALKIGEKGTEAAAATTVAISASGAAASSDPLKIMVVDRPFFAAIVNNESGAALFSGIIADPSAAG